MRPENDLVGADVAQELGDRARVGVRLQEEILRLRKGDHALHNWERDLPDVQVELAEPAMLPGAIRGLDIRHDRPVPGPREHIRAVAVRPKHGNDTVAQYRPETELALVRRAGDGSGGD